LSIINRKGAIALGLATPFIFSAAAGEGQQLEDLYAAAAAEGQLTIYTGGGTLGPEIKAFNTRYPQIHVTVMPAYSNVNDVKIDRMLSDHDVTADVVSFQTVQDFVRWNAAGELLHYRFPGLEMYDRHYADPSGAFVATALFPLTFGYNAQLVAPGDVPRSALDFLRPEFNGKAITCYPHDDDATLYLFYTLQQKYGWEFVDHYMANAPVFIEGHLGVLQAIAAGKSLVTFDCSAHVAFDLQDQGRPIAIAFSNVDPTPVFFNTSAILRAAPHPDAAKLFTSWYLSLEQQSRTGTWSGRRDVPPPRDAKPLSSYQLANDYRAFMVRTSLIEELRRRFLAYTGPVTNRS
jgi:ABC-type Fe3+ transport system substrate-binding protein